MHVYLDQEDQQTLNEIKYDLIKLQSVALVFGKDFITYVYQSMYRQLMSYKEYSYDNIRAKGLKNILIERAFRFFGVEVTKTKTVSKKVKQPKSSRKKLVRTLSWKKILVPIYVSILLILWIKSKMIKKNVKHNNYT